MITKVVLLGCRTWLTGLSPFSPLFYPQFVKPRAMPISRDVSTMTDEAELSAAKRQSWANRRHSSDEEGSTSSRRHEHTPKRKARTTIGRKSQAVGK